MNVRPSSVSSDVPRGQATNSLLLSSLARPSNVLAAADRGSIVRGERGCVVFANVLPQQRCRNWATLAVDLANPMPYGGPGPVSLLRSACTSLAAIMVATLRTATASLEPWDAIAMTNLTGHLKLFPQSPHPRAAAIALDSLSVAVIFSAETLGESQLIERRVPVKFDGSYQLSLSENAISDEATRIAVLASSGEVIASEGLRALLVGRILKDLVVASPSVEFRPSDVQRAAALTQRITGRLMAPDGDTASVARMPVNLEAEVGTDGIQQLWSGISDKNGYFNATIPNRRFAAARARLGVGEHQRDLDIVLDAQGHFPSPLILVAAGLAHGHGEDCGCNEAPPAKPEADELAVQGQSYSQDLGTSCQSMTTPNRTLEEFDFFQIVRTTDPSIKGNTLPGKKRPDIGREDLGKLVFDIGTLAKETGASALAGRNEASTRSVSLKADGRARDQQREPSHDGPRCDSKPSRHFRGSPSCRRPQREWCGFGRPLAGSHP